MEIGVVRRHLGTQMSATDPDCVASLAGPLTSGLCRQLKSPAHHEFLATPGLEGCAEAPHLGAYVLASPSWKVLKNRRTVALSGPKPETSRTSEAFLANLRFSR